MHRGEVTRGGEGFPGKTVHVLAANGPLFGLRNVAEYGVIPAPHGGVDG